MTLRQALTLAIGAVLFLAGFMAAYWWMDGRLDNCRLERAGLLSAVDQRDETIKTLRKANEDLGIVIERQNDRVNQIAREGQERQSQAAQALAAVRKSQDATRATIASLRSQIESGTGDCTAAVAVVRAGL